MPTSPASTQPPGSLWRTTIRWAGCQGTPQRRLPSRPRSVMTLHRLAPAEPGLADANAPLDPAEVYELPHPDCMYAENFNRWISRSRPAATGVSQRSSPRLRVRRPATAAEPVLAAHSSRQGAPGRQFLHPGSAGLRRGGPESTFESTRRWAISGTPTRCRVQRHRPQIVRRTTPIIFKRLFRELRDGSRGVTGDGRGPSALVGHDPARVRVEAED